MPGMMEQSSKSSKKIRSSDSVIDDISINDENWRCIVAMLVESQVDQLGYASMLYEACKNGNRKAIHAIDRNNIQPAKIRNNSKKKISEGTSLSPRIRHSSLKAELSQCSDGNVADGVVTATVAVTEAKLIKQTIYEARLESLARNATELELAREREREFLAMQRCCARIDLTSTADERKPNSRLRKRGEEWRDRAYVNDAPLNGPDLYILLTGFRDPNLPYELIKLGVPLICILKLENPELKNDNDNSNNDYCTCSEITTTTLQNESTIDFWQKFDTTNLGNLIVHPYSPSSHFPDNTLYDDVSNTMYYLHDLLGAHSDYLKSMRIVEMTDPRQFIVVNSYEKMLDAVPGEFFSVPLMLEALLKQVLENLRVDDVAESERTYEENDDVLCPTSPLSHEKCTDSLNKANHISTSSAIERLAAKLRQLNLKYDLLVDKGVEEKELSSSRLSEPELILHGDSLRLNACHVNDATTIRRCGSAEAPNFETLAQLWIDEAWRNENYEAITNCKKHLPGIMEKCAKEGIDRPRVKHLLNLLGLGKLIDTVSKNCLCTVDVEVSQKSDRDLGTPNDLVKEALNEKEDNKFDIDDAFLDCNCNISSNSSMKESNSRHRHSDGLSSLATAASRDQHNFLRASVKPRGLILRSFEDCDDLFGLMDESLLLDGMMNAQRQNSRIRDLEEFEQAELLGRRAFTQIVQDCLISYQSVTTRHFAATDSILLLFHDSERQCRACKTIERRVTCALRTPVCLSDFCKHVVTEETEWLKRRQSSGAGSFEGKRDCGDDNDGGKLIFLDEDFTLPGSLKDSARRVGAGDEKINDDKQFDATSITEEWVLPKSIIDFVGYDLGDRRVQVSSFTQTYRAKDDTEIRLIKEKWILGKDPKERSTISVQVSHLDKPNCWSFWYNESNLAAQGVSFFHLTMGNGVVIAFEKRKSDSVAFQRHGSLPYELQISWASGLIIKPVDCHDGCKDCPFYVLQYYITNGQRYDVNYEKQYETHRKYLPNGDVVKFFNDGSVVVLRPNGIIITVTSLEKEDDDRLTTTSDICFTEGTENSWNPTHPCDEICDCLFCDPRSSSQNKLRYIVLELDGRRYEVINGRIVRELDGLRSYIDEEYSSEEKFLRREDGTDVLFTADAGLVVDFPDGTRTRSQCIIETEAASCDWSEHELELHFEEEKCKPEGFVSIIQARGRVEHPHYASVARCCDSCLTVTLPFNENEKTADGIAAVVNAELHLKLKPRGVADATDAVAMIRLDERVRVELNDDNVSLSHRSNCNCKNQQEQNNYSSRIIFPTTSDNEILLTLRDESTLLRVNRDDFKLRVIPKAPTTITVPVCRCNKATEAKPKNYRIFALERSGEAYEYRCRSEVKKMIERMTTEEDSGLVCRPVEGRPGAERQIALRSVESVLRDLGYRSFEYKIPEAEPSAIYRMETKDEEDEDLDFWNRPIFIDDKKSDHRILIARLFEDIARSEDKSLIKMQKSLVAYWREISTGVQNRTDESDDSTAPTTCGCRRNMETWMRDIARARVHTIDPEIYEDGRRHLKKLKVESNEQRTRRTINQVYKQRRN